MFKRLSHPMMYVTDLDRAVKFYTEKLGFEPVFVAPGGYASLKHSEAGCRLDLHPSEADSKDVGYGPIPYFACDNIEQSVEELKARDVKVGMPRSEGGGPKFVTFWDSEGNALGLEEIRF